MNRFGKKIEELRIRQNESQGEAARAVGTSQSTISRIESGDYPLSKLPVALLARLSEHYDITTSETISLLKNDLKNQVEVNIQFGNKAS